MLLTGAKQHRLRNLAHSPGRFHQWMMENAFPMSSFNWVDRLSPDLRAEVLARHKPVNIRSARDIFQPGDKARGIFRVLEGRADMYALLEDGRSVLFNCYFPGECFGELPMLDGGTHVATLSLTEGARLSCLSPEDVADLRRNRPEFDTALTLSVCNTLRTLFAIHLAKLSLQPEALLLYRLENFRSRLKKGEEVEVKIPISQEEFARMLGVSRRTMVDALAKLQGKKSIRRSYGSIHVNASAFAT
jgi:CRP-like cAMP-binding protein